MSKAYKGAMELMGDTPLVEVVNIKQQEKLKATLLVKLEYPNPAGGIRDRAGKATVEDVEQRGILGPGSTITELTSGDVGIGLAPIAAAKGYRMILTMSDIIDIERRNVLKAYGAEIVLTPGEPGMAGVIEKAEELTKETPGSFIPEQFMNPVNPKVHMETTGSEIWRDTQGRVDPFMASMDIGGTIAGVGTYLRRKSPDLKVTTVKSAASTVLSGKAVGPHKTQGIGTGFVSKVLDTGIYNEIITVDNDVSFATSKVLVRTEELLIGISSDAILYAAIQTVKRPGNEGKTIAALPSDSGDRYYSTPLFVE